MGSDLTTYLETKRGVPFSWERDNCMSFVVEYLDLPGLPLRWFIGHRTARTCLVAYLRRAKEIGHESLADAFDALLLRDVTLYPRPGYVVGRPVQSPFGAIYGLHARGANWFFTEDAGLQPFDPHHADMYWRAR